MAIQYAWRTLRTLGRKAGKRVQKTGKALRGASKTKKVAAAAGVVAVGDKIGDIVVPFEMRPKANTGYHTPTPEGNSPSDARGRCLAA